MFWIKNFCANRKNKNRKIEKMSTQKNTQYDFLFKLLLIGSSGVGKSCNINKNKLKVF
jgi:GTPase SAR1 family protein